MMTYFPKYEPRICFVNCGLPGEQCACYRAMMALPGLKAIESTTIVGTHGGVVDDDILAMLEGARD
ncbi:hypothetical protein [Roseovarius sp.]|uniref:hypothetical protein n=1 Tax=Roseovarius sp. TaxID=1486281 RepID=UPI003BAA9A75